MVKSDVDDVIDDMELLNDLCFGCLFLIGVVLVDGVCCCCCCDRGEVKLLVLLVVLVVGVIGG